jgi:hypothetical protein
MGADQSKGFAEWTTTDVVDAVASLGQQYVDYEDVILDTPVDGEFLVELEEAEIEPTLVELGVRSRLHRRVLAKKILIIREAEVQDLSVTRVETVPLVPEPAPFRRQGSLSAEEKLNLWRKMQEMAQKQLQDNEELMKREAALRSQVAIFGN